MSSSEPRKRDRIRKYLPSGWRGRPDKNAGPCDSLAIGETSTHTSRAASSATLVASLGKATTPSTTTPTTSTRHLAEPTESKQKPEPGDVINDAAFGSDSGRPRLISEAAAGMDMAHTQAENEGKQPVSTAIRSLWGRAINSDALSPQERKTLTDTGLGVGNRETASAVDAVRSIMDGILSKKKGELWKVNFRGEEIVLRDVGMKILHWVDTFKQIGDIIVQYDPVHAALPWAGFRFLLQACVSKQENVDAILVGLEKTACLIDRCAIYESLCTGDSAASKNLEKSILRLYAAILKFFAGGIKILNGGQHSGVSFTTADSSQIVTPSGQDSQDRFPICSMRSSSWKKLLDEMLLSPKPNV